MFSALIIERTLTFTKIQANWARCGSLGTLGTLGNLDNLGTLHNLGIQGENDWVYDLVERGQCSLRLDSLNSGSLKGKIGDFPTSVSEVKCE